MFKHVWATATTQAEAAFIGNPAINPGSPGRLKPARPLPDLARYSESEWREFSNYFENPAFSAHPLTPRATPIHGENRLRQAISRERVSSTRLKFARLHHALEVYA